MVQSTYSMNEYTIHYTIRAKLQWQLNFLRFDDYLKTERCLTVSEWGIAFF